MKRSGIFCKKLRRFPIEGNIGLLTDKRGMKMRKEQIKNKAVKVKNKGLNALASLIFSRIMLVALILVVQIALLIWIFELLGVYTKWVLYAMNILAAVFVIIIINSDENPAFKLTWMLPLCVVPVFGVVLYLFIQGNPVRIGAKKSLRKRIEETEGYLQQNEDVIQRMQDENIPITDLAYYIQNVNGFPAYDKTQLTYFADGEQKLQDLIPELKKAEKFIFLEYFIINPGRVWEEVLEVLEQKAAEGVEVRLMYDGFNSILKLPRKYPETLQKKGIKVRVFAPVVPLLSSHQNYRDHRKILVIDGKIAYNGGINLADEYMNYIVRFGYWKDTAVKLRGDAVKSFTAMFLQMWNMMGDDVEDYDRYLCPQQANSLPGQNGFIIPYNDDPCNGEDVAEEVYLDILNKAKDYVYIMTPYLVPENEIITGLRFAAQRGVDVRIIMPHIPDKKVTFSIGHTYYNQLIDAGVKIYEFTPGFVHAKMFLSDDIKAVVGTINLDFRSLYEHYECATFIYGNSVIRDIKEDFRNTFAQCQRFTKEDYKKLPFLHRVCGRVCRLFAPLM